MNAILHNKKNNVHYKKLINFIKYLFKYNTNEILIKCKRIYI